MGRQSFDVGPGGTLDVDLSALTAEGQQLARWALEAWTNATAFDGGVRLDLSGAGGGAIDLRGFALAGLDAADFLF